MKIQLTADDLAPGEARAWIEDLRDQLHPHHDHVVLIVSELVTNAVRHAGTRQGDIDVELALDETKIRIEVTDGGPCFEAGTSRLGGGLGLVIVDRLAASWGAFDDGSCTVWAEIERSRPQTGSGRSMWQPSDVRRSG